MEPSVPICFWLCFSCRVAAGADERKKIKGAPGIWKKGVRMLVVAKKSIPLFSGVIFPCACVHNREKKRGQQRHARIYGANAPRRARRAGVLGLILCFSIKSTMSQWPPACASNSAFSVHPSLRCW
nr:hypothetical protein [Pandoravirus massiliensis]